MGRKDTEMNQVSDKDRVHGKASPRAGEGPRGRGAGNAAGAETMDTELTLWGSFARGREPGQNVGRQEHHK